MKSIINHNKVHIYQTKFKHNASEILDGNDISNKFNDYFINIGSIFANAIPHTSKSPLNYLRGSVSETIFLSPVTENEIGKLFLSLKNTACGYGDMNSMSLKLCSQYVTQPLTHICNWLLHMGYSLIKWKLPMWFHYTNRVIQCFSVITGLFPCYLYCQRSLRK